ncbi:DUF222 domain-containing protein [Actinomadura soli]|uniref:DUF222 domain-containing protein n=1 Tax=Actinomadura soli TaxID=2508997 RepID=A0A5C4JHI8_9ACTN|nr:HNH endonuclease signature motif containing protein [Actinomadura soli]TMR06346.1 DUF222 domain-containing protein [Actinomadura soli]
MGVKFVAVPVEIVSRIADQREWGDREWFPPGPQLAICLSGGKERLADLTDDELLQVAAAARRQTSWAQARELAAIAELAQRREDAGAPDYRVLSARESVTEEVAAALTVTGNTAATLVHLAETLSGPLAATGDALEAGRIDLAKARVIVDTTDGLPCQVVGGVEAAALAKASEQTTGQLRRRIKRIAQRLALEAVEERKRQAVRSRRLELFDTPAGTADLVLCDLPSEDAHAIYNKITAAAQGLKCDGDPRPLHCIRVDLATQLLHGHQLPDAIRTLLADPASDPPRPPHEPDLPTGNAVSGLAAVIDRRLGHVRGRVRPAELPDAIAAAAQRVREELASARDAACHGHDRQPGYRPPAALRREVQARFPTCVFPTCNQPSHRCDLDHTVPWRPGITCRCNLAPLCRRHHRLKQSPGWHLHQPWPGLLLWVTPSGAWYIVRSDRQ